MGIIVIPWVERIAEIASKTGPRQSIPHILETNTRLAFAGGAGLRFGSDLALVTIAELNEDQA